MSSRLDILWSPAHHDKFIVWGPDITLYEVARIKEIEKKTTCMYFKYSNNFIILNIGHYISIIIIIM